MRRLATLLLACFLAVAGALTYWQFIAADSLVYGPHNGRLAEQAAEVLRGKILDRTGAVLAYSETTSQGVERRYADPRTMAPVTGYYSLQFGASGLESGFERYLRGDVQTNALDTVVAELLHRPKVGSNLRLTIDSRLQAVATQAMGADRGAVVALDPQTGAVLALVSTPSFDPNRIDENWSGLLNDPGRPLFNRATQGLYTPGSVFKIVTATAAIDLGLVDLDRRYHDTLDLVVDGFRIANKNHRNGATDVTFVDDFAYSCNVTFAKTGLSLDTKPLPLGDNMPDPPPWARGIDESRRRFLEYAGRFGLDAPLPFDLPTSVSRVGSQRLDRVELANTAFGQGELQVTPLLMALGAAAIANGGKMPQPYLVQDIRDAGGRILQQHSPQVLRQVMSPETARSMNRLMVASVQKGYAENAAIPGIQVGGKTGSAEVETGEPTHSWFIGYAPADNPRIAVAVIMENKGSGATFATPAARRIMETALK